MEGFWPQQLATALQGILLHTLQRGLLCLPIACYTVDKMKYVRHQWLCSSQAAAVLQCDHHTVTSCVWVQLQQIGGVHDALKTHHTTKIAIVQQTTPILAQQVCCIALHNTQHPGKRSSSTTDATFNASQQADRLSLQCIGQDGCYQP